MADARPSLRLPVTLAPDLSEPDAFRLRARRALFEEPLDPQRDAERFGCHVIASILPEPEFWDKAKPAAVLVPVVQRAEGLNLVLTERSAGLSTHAGQVAFPGGRIEPGESAGVAALREAEEEIGLPPVEVEPIGFLPPYFSGTGFRVQPLVGLVSPEVRFAPDPGEVARVFEVPLALVLDPARYRRGEIFWRGRERSFYILDYAEAYIWGVTAGIMRNFAERF
ncbi:MAG: CoA pyrophosphatase [Rhizobiales bacterium]|nr:CoA pyrophosphatase [Hyphomicrobiales bacterium]